MAQFLKLFRPCYSLGPASTGGDAGDEGAGRSDGGGGGIEGDAGEASHSVRNAAGGTVATFVPWWICQALRSAREPGEPG